MTDERDREQELNRFWNAVAAGEPVADGFALDAEDMAVVQRLHRTAAATLPGHPADEAWPAVLARISAAATARGDRRERSDLRVAPSPFGPNGRAHGAAFQPTVKPGRRPWHLAPEFVATAALVVLTLTAGLFTVGPLRAPSPDAVVPFPAVEEGSGIVVGQLDLLWQAKIGSAPLEDPSGVTIDPEGNLWVVETHRGSLEIFAADGAFIETWGEAGSGEGQFDFSGPTTEGYGDVAFDADGNIYVVDSGNVRIQKFAPDRRFLLSWGGQGDQAGQFLRPASIAVDAAGTVYVSDEQRADIQMFDRDGGFLGAFGGLGIEEGQLVLPQGIAVDPQGMLWVVDRGNNRLQQFDADGRVHAIVGSVGFEQGELNQPYDIAIDDLGRLYVTEPGMGRLQVFSQDGRALATVGGLADIILITPVGIAVAEDGVVYVSDTDGIQAYQVLLPVSAMLMP